MTSLSLRTFELCDAATTRGGFMTVVNSGINSLSRTSYPAELKACLAIALELSGIDDPYVIEIAVTAHNEDDPDVAISPYEWSAEIDPAEIAPGFDSVVLNIAVDARTLIVPASGIYRFELAANGATLSTMRVIASTVPEDAQFAG